MMHPLSPFSPPPSPLMPMRSVSWYNYVPSTSDDASRSLLNPHQQLYHLNSSNHLPNSVEHYQNPGLRNVVFREPVIGSCALHGGKNDHTYAQLSGTNRRQSDQLTGQWYELVTMASDCPTNRNHRAGCTNSIDRSRQELDSLEEGRQEVDSTVGGREEVGSVDGGREEVDSTVGGRQEVDSTVGGKQEVGSTVGGRQEVGPTVGGREEVDSTMGGKQEVGPTVGGRQIQADEGDYTSHSLDEERLRSTLSLNKPLPVIIGRHSKLLSMPESVTLKSRTKKAKNLRIIDSSSIRNFADQGVQRQRDELVPQGKKNNQSKLVPKNKKRKLSGDESDDCEGSPIPPSKLVNLKKSRPFVKRFSFAELQQKLFKRFQKRNQNLIKSISATPTRQSPRRSAQPVPGPATPTRQSPRRSAQPVPGPTTPARQSPRRNAQPVPGPATPTRQSPRRSAQPVPGPATPTRQSPRRSAQPVPGPATPARQSPRRNAQPVPGPATPARQSPRRSAQPVPGPATPARQSPRRSAQPVPGPATPARQSPRRGAQPVPGHATPTRQSPRRSAQPVPGPATPARQSPRRQSQTLSDKPHELVELTDEVQYLRYIKAKFSSPMKRSASVRCRRKVAKMLLESNRRSELI